MSMVQQAVEIGAPLHTVYQQLEAFENYPQFMTGVQQVTRIGNDQTHWVMEVEGHRREFDAQITECTLDERVSWTTTEGPMLAETITLRPMGEMRTQIVAQLEADVAYLMPSDRHGQASLSRQLKSDLNTFKSLIEAGWPAAADLGASSKDLSGMGGKMLDPASPASVATRARGGRPQPGAGWGTSAGGFSNAERGTDVDITSAPGISSAADLDDVLAPGRRIGGTLSMSGGAAGGAAPMGGKAMSARDGRTDGAVNEEERGSSQDW
ncbi:SRPBCC family protein [Amorphoplanes digitatis]|uniref:Ribosome-associated toxin RatA of RatAB toxin-antitoxin module n=1 Tax=Actinoplanes digitatis TaxID=1868 RepID=A0A7W7MMU5_9ACTN|nr:SRPBCC family protein [Actinoplanes digitatis]MBB4759679.1 ribosome-associated toxin RatA of RatAB toxin-antitoxin module [Actinoplanes digitatis]